VYFHNTAHNEHSMLKARLLEQIKHAQKGAH